MSTLIRYSRERDDVCGRYPIERELIIIKQRLFINVETRPNASGTTRRNGNWTSHVTRETSQWSTQTVSEMLLIYSQDFLRTVN